MVPYISVADLSDYMGQTLTSDLATIAVDSACETVRTFLNRRLNLTTQTVEVDGSGTDALALDGPLVDVDTVTVDDVVVEDTDYVLGISQLYRVDGSVWPVGRRNVSVTYTAGYAIDEGDVGADSGDVGTITRMPSDIREVTLELAAGFMSVAETRFHAQAVRDAVGGSEPEEGPIVLQGLTASQRRRLRPHRYPAVA